MRQTVAAFVLIFGTLGATSLTQTKRGTICVMAISPKRPQRFSPGQNYNPETLSIRFDGREAVLWSQTDSMKFEDLDTAIHHLVVLTSDGKRIQSFWFRFSEYSSDALCLAFDGYQGVQLQKSTPRCKCR
jgi:hypothetical protein